MRLLLDTHIFLWWLADDPALAAKARKLIGDGNNEVYVSAASVWEISVKKSLGKLEAPENIEAIVEQERFQKLPITLCHGEAAPGSCRHTTVTLSTGCLLPRPDVRT
jgi:PIN domain nuclease of toxin-antitoxin system